MASRKAAGRAVVPGDLWQVPVYLPYLQPTLKDAAVKSAEKRLGVKLPRAYIAALEIQNGGYLRRTEHPSGRAPVDCIAGIGRRYPSIFEYDWSEVKKHAVESGLDAPSRIDDLIPFAGDGHYHYCFDYRGSGRRKEPRIAYIDVECFDADEVLAPDFGTFLRQLRAPEARETVYGIATDASVKSVAAALSKVSGIRFEDQGDQDHGYRLFRARLPGQGNWAWLSPNRVRRGFVRKTDKDYARLAKRMTELVDRYPEQSDCGFFLTCTNFESRAGKSLVRVLRALPFPTRKVTLD